MFCIFVLERNLLISYIYLYIFTNLLSTSIHSYKKKRKKKPPGEKRKKYHRTKKNKKKKTEKANFVTPVEKIKGYAIYWSKAK